MLWYFVLLKVLKSTFIFDWVNFLVCIYFFNLQYTLLDLLSKVQASETELLEALKKIDALEIDGGLNCLPIDQIS